MVDVTTAFVRVTQPLISMCQAGINKATLLAGYTELKAAADALSAAMVAKGAAGSGIPEVQILGSLIGIGLSDTGTADPLNLLASSQQAFSGIDWIPTFLTAADGAGTSTLTEVTGGSSPRHNIFQGVSITPSVQYTIVMRIKQSLRTRSCLVFADSSAAGSANYAIVTFDLAGGAIGIAAAANGNFSTASATITASSSGFYICTITVTVNANGNYTVQIFADAGSGSAAQTLNYAGNASSPALIIDYVGLYAGASGTYIPLNANGGAAASTIQQAFSPNGGTTAYWGTQTANAYPAFDAGVAVVYTRHRFAPRPTAATAVGQWPYTPDYALSIAGAQIQTSVSDSTFASPTTVDTIPAAGSLPYYPRFWLSERVITGAAAARYIRFLPPSVSFGGLSEWQVFAKAGTTANARPVQPVITPNGGRFPSLSTPVTMTSTQGAAIYYTTDGSTPTTSSTKYNGQFTLSIGSGSTVTIKAIANLASLSTPNSLVTTSAPFYGYGLKPNDNWYDTDGNLIEAHAGSAPLWNPNTSAYYLVGQFMNINNALHLSATTVEPNYAPAVYLYKGVPLDPKDPNGILNWKNLGPILGPLVTSTFPVAGNYNLLYNAANNNYVIWTSVFNLAGNSNLYYASTSGSDITSGWSWNLTPVVTNTFFNFATLVDSDGVTAYVVWRPTLTGTSIQQLNSTYTGLTGAALTLTNSALREGFAFFKYPNIVGGTYFIVTGAANPYNSTTSNVDLRYIYNTGSTPLVNSWNAVPSSGADAWNGFTALGTNYNGQAFSSFLPQGKLQPVITMDFWNTGNLYGSRQVWLPLTMTSTTLAITHPVSWDPSQLTASNTLQTLTLSANTFVVGNAQGTVIGTVLGTTAGSTLTLTNSNSGAVQLVSGVIQVGATPPGTAGSFNIQLTETLAGYSNSPNVTTLSITENAAGPSLSGSVVTSTTQQSLNLTSLGPTDWIAYGYDPTTPGPAAFDRKSGGGSKISTLSQVGPTTLHEFNYSSTTPNWNSSWTDGTNTGTVSNEADMVYCPAPVSTGSGSGESFTVLADTTLRTLKVYVGLSSGTSPANCKLTATLSDASAGPYTDASVTESTASTNLMAVYTITYAAASGSQTLTVTWLKNDSNGGNVIIHAAALS